MSPAPPDYVDVNERIRQFYKKHPKGSLQSEYIGTDLGFVVVKAYAYRDPDDKLPGTGLAWEPVPGPTPFTKNSELQNAETSAWGRAIVALGFETKHIASANEVKNRQAEGEALEEGAVDDGSSDSSSIGAAPSSSAPSFENPTEKAEKAAKITEFGKVLVRLKELDEHTDWVKMAKDYTQKHFGKDTTRYLTLDQLRVLTEEFESRRLQLEINLAYVEAHTDAVTK
jgi:hypothetical protein